MEPHISVLLKEAIDGLDIKPQGIYLDGTVGLGGHSYEIAKRLDGGRLIAIDRDNRALEYARNRLKDYDDRITYVHANFAESVQVLDKLGIDKIDGALYDFGVSSPQIDGDAARGFSYAHDNDLDMRMDETQSLTARDVVNTWSESELRKILYEYGEERYAPQIARAIVRRREDKPIETTFELSDLIRSAMPAKALREKQHPAKRSFQSFRVATNSEFQAIEEMLATIPDRLNVGGRICAISFHSLEEVRVKSAFMQRVNGCKCPRDYPCVCGFKPTLRLITKKPIVPTAEEIEQNPRSRSAKLRIAERI
ncbi:MAG: 16S rRNA (cytosine(1402)-N(4))-methyltransferase RsmH [Oscillospiraceae bacterium]|jgi:16S rRNA (cytosine1402-N4)-methyltransferase|nr:16S rRNA (cytosine(1402)-N(4))-methyltransferase RsmH [Oscillospiraceae bacterium]